MALTQKQVSELFVSIFGRASEGSGNKFWQQSVDTKSAANDMLKTDAAKAYFGSSLDSNQAFIEAIYKNTLNKTLADDAAGIKFWVDALNSGMSRGEVVASLVASVASHANSTDPKTKAAYDQFNNRVDVSNYVADNIENVPANGDLAVFKAYNNNTTNDVATKNAQIIKVNSDAAALSKGQDYYLTDKQDILVGTDGNNTFIARGNNTLTNADIIDGGKGVDTVYVMLDNKETAESPLLTNIEVLKVQVQATTTDSGDNDVDASNLPNADIESNIDAGDMKSVLTYINDNSRADLTIEDVSTNSNLTTLVMRETDMGDVDYNVFFDPENIKAPGAGDLGATLSIKLANVLNIKEGKNPVEKFTELSFTAGSKVVKVDISTATSYDDVVTKIQAAITAAGISGLTVAKQAATPSYFSIDVGSYTAGELAGSYNPILITNTGSGVLTPGTIVVANNTTNANMTNTMTNVAPTSIPSLTQTNVVFDRVGRDSKGGDFLAGSDSTGNSGSKGIEQFNVSVERSSHLTSIASTNNTLEVLNIKNAAGYNGNLKVEKIEDVRVIDAATMTGAATITATLTDKVVSKYLDLKDTQSNPAGDNSDKAYLNVVDTYFSYDFGSNNDTFNLTIDGSNLAAAGTTTREDFVLEINGGAGNDTITTDIGTLTANGYANSKLNANLTINGGTGNDTIWTKGEGDIKINAGTGNDTVYTDNTGVHTIYTTQESAVATAQAAYDLSKTDTNLNALNAAKAKLAALNDGKAVFVFNANNTDIHDLQSNANTTLTNAVNLGLTVTFQGVTTDISQIANSFGALKNVEIKALHVNQAIKDAINNDAVLSKVLVAVDGPANTLIVKSLIDGKLTTADLAVNIGQLTYNATPTAAQLPWDISKNNVSKSTWDAQQAVIPALGLAVGPISYNDALAADGATTGITSGTITFAGTETDGANEVLTTTITDSLAATYTFTTTVTGSTAATAATTVVSAVTPAGGGTKTFTVTEAAGVVTIVSNDGTAFTATTVNTIPGATINITAGALVATSYVNELAGANASHLGTDNTIDLGTGNDVLVLSTDSNSAEKIVFKDANFGNDVIYNFTSGAAATNDKLDFSAFVSKVDTVAKVIAGNKFLATTFDTTKVETDAVNITKALDAYIAGYVADIANSSKSIVFLNDSVDTTKVYAYQIEDGIGANTATVPAGGYATVTATFLGSVELGDVTFNVTNDVVIA